MSVKKAIVLRSQDKLVTIFEHVQSFIHNASGCWNVNVFETGSEMVDEEIVKAVLETKGFIVFLVF